MLQSTTPHYTSQTTRSSSGPLLLLPSPVGLYQPDYSVPELYLVNNQWSLPPACLRVSTPSPAALPPWLSSLEFINSQGTKDLTLVLNTATILHCFGNSTLSFLNESRIWCDHHHSNRRFTWFPQLQPQLQLQLIKQHGKYYQGSVKHGPKLQSEVRHCG